MSKKASSLLLVGIKQEEVTSQEQSTLGRYQASESVWENRLRHRSRFLPLQEPGSNESDYLRSGDEWQPPPSLSYENRSPNLLPSAGSSLSAEESKTTSRTSSSNHMLTPGLLPAPTTTEIPNPKREREDPAVEKPTGDLKGRHRVGLRAYTCDVCGREFTRGYDLKLHVDWVHKGLRAYTCDVCGRAFNRRSRLKEHVDCVHKDFRPHKCDMCGKGFSLPGQRKKHVNNVHEKAKHICGLCGKAFRQKHNMNQHIDYVHTDLREHSCRLCDKTYKRTSELNSHVLRVHKNYISREDQRGYICTLCDEAFIQVSEVTLHVNDVHKHLGEYICEFCGMTFVTEQTLERHLDRVHQNKINSKHLCINRCEFGWKARQSRHNSIS